MQPLSEITAQANLRGITRVTIARIVCLSSPDQHRKGRPIIMPTHEALIGRQSATNHLFAFEDSEISRSHAKFSPGNVTEWQLIDQGSRNGTFVNGSRISAHALKTGDVIRVGSTLLLYQELIMDVGEQLAASNAPAFVGSSVALKRVIDSAHQVAQKNTSVLIHGETGVGKELVANEIHRMSLKQGPFIAVNCGALAPELAASELFGHSAGSFTGASTRTEGLFHAADGGTLFLDEIGELPLKIQPLLLRALETGSVRSIGQSKSKPFNTRIVAATNKNLELEIAKGTFRADLYARINGWQICVPPLRKRREDVLDIARSFVDQAGSFASFHPDVQESLTTYDWPFNIRELKHAIESACTKAAGETQIDLIHLPRPVYDKIEKRFIVSPEHLPQKTPLIASVRREGTPSKDELNIALKHFAGNIGHVASFFGKDRKQIYRWVQHNQLDPSDYRELTSAPADYP